MSLEIVEWVAGRPLALPYFEGRVPAGFPSPAEDYLEVPLDLAEYLVENKAATFMMRVTGDSMTEAGIQDGDLLVVDRSIKPVTGSIIVVAVNGEYTVKRLRRGADCVWLDPANPRFQPVRVSWKKSCTFSAWCVTPSTRCGSGDGGNVRADRLQQLLRKLRAGFPAGLGRQTGHCVVEQ